MSSLSFVLHDEYGRYAFQLRKKPSTLFQFSLYCLNLCYAQLFRVISLSSFSFEKLMQILVSSRDSDTQNKSFI